MFHCVHFECPSQQDNEEFAKSGSPLKLHQSGSSSTIQRHNSVGRSSYHSNPSLMHLHPNPPPIEHNEPLAMENDEDVAIEHEIRSEPGSVQDQELDLN